jgi:hypothetical protein
MAKYGGLTGPGSHGFPGWPSKVHGAPSGRGRYNKEAGRQLKVPPIHQDLQDDWPFKNEIVNGRWLVPPGFISCKGSKVAKTLCFTFGNHCLENTTGHFYLFTECKEGMAHRFWLNGGDWVHFPFRLIYEIAKAEEPGAVYDEKVHNNIYMPYHGEVAVPDWSKEVFSIPGAPGSLNPDASIMDQNIVTGGVPVLGTCSIPVTGSSNLEAMFFEHHNIADILYVVEKSGNVFGYNGFELPFALVQLMVRAEAPGLFYETYIKGRYPVNSAVHVFPDRLRQVPQPAPRSFGA